MSAPSTIAWYLVHTKPRQEDIALMNLERQGYTCYLPRLSVEKARRRRAEVVVEAMFPRYLFVQLDTGMQAKSWAPIRSTLGVSRLVHFGSTPAKVDDQLVDLLRTREQTAAPQMMFEPGQSVTIVDGPFAGIEAIYQTTDAERRAHILLELLSNQVRLSIDPASLRPRESSATDTKP